MAEQIIPDQEVLVISYVLRDLHGKAASIFSSIVSIDLYFPPQTACQDYVIAITFYGEIREF